MIYMISDCKGAYLRRDTSGNFTPVKNRNQGDIYDCKEKAENIISNCINKNLRRRYKVIEIDNTADIKKEAKPAEVAQIEINNEEELDSILLKIDDFARIILNMDNRKQELIANLSEIDKEINDINHYIELYSFNAYQGWLAFKMLKERLQKRRRIKDELHILNLLNEQKITSSTFTDIKSSIDKMSLREYQPRKLNELF